MAWTAPRTWATSEVVTSSIMNTHVRDNLLALGPSTVGTTKAAVETAVGTIDGMRMRLRIDSTPFSFVELTYDATYAKWVSAPIAQRITTADSVTQFSGALTVYAEFSAGAGSPYWILWKPFDTAGLKPQFRISWLRGSWGASGVNNGAKVTPGYRRTEVGTGLTETSVRMTAAAGELNLVLTETQFRGAWIDLDGGWTVQEWIRPTLWGAGNAGNTGTWGATLRAHIVIEHRWVNQ